MRFNKTALSLICMLISAVLMIELAGCGTILYPERKGQKGGRIDPGIAILDGLGLLLFIIPGVIAFAVDFTTGAIYLPGTARKSSVPEGNKVIVVRVNPKELNEETIKEVLIKEAGQSPTFDLSDAEIHVLNGLDEIEKKLMEAKRSDYLSSPRVSR